MTEKAPSNKFAVLHQQVKETLPGKPANITSVDDLSPEDTQRLFHELQVHQIELEMQNEELRRAQRELKASRDRYFDLYNFAPVGYFVLDEQGLILEVNRAGANLLDMARDDLIKQPLSHFIVKEDQGIYYLKHEQLFETREPQVCELRMVREDGSWSWSRIEAVLAQNGGGQVVCWAMVSNITEPKQAEEALRESLRQVERAKQEWETTADSLPQLVCLVDDQGRILRANRTVERWGLARVTNVKGRKVHELFHPGCKDPACYLDAFWRRAWEELACGRPAECEAKDEVLKRHLHIQALPFLAQVREARDEKCEAATDFAAIIIHDITRRKRAEDTLRESHRRLENTLTELRETQRRLIRQERLAAVGQLTAGIAHDFRNLLSTIIIYANLALRHPGLPPKLMRNIETIINESKKAAGLVQQLLDFSSRAMVERRPLDLASFTGEVLDVLRRTIPENIQFSLEVEQGKQSSAFIVRADSGRIQQVLINLATNARDAMPHGGKLRFELSRINVAVDGTPPVADMEPGAWVCLTVSDTGTGMTPEVRAHLFEPFFTTKEVNKGTGLGLAQVYGIVRQHKGYIGVETELGQGTTFRIYLPAYKGKVKSAEAETLSALPQGQGETILLVEDNKSLREAGQSILESLGYRVLTAANGREALAVWEAEGSAADRRRSALSFTSGVEVDLVITDIVMPEMGGKELVRELKRSAPTLKALGIIGHATEKAAQELREAGFLDVIHKPFEIETLARATRRALSASVGRWI